MTVDESSSQDATLIDDDLVAALGFEPVTTIETSNGHARGSDPDDSVDPPAGETLVDSSAVDRSVHGASEADSSVVEASESNLDEVDLRGGLGPVNGFGIDEVTSDDASNGSLDVEAGADIETDEVESASSGGSFFDLDEDALDEAGEVLIGADLDETDVEARQDVATDDDVAIAEEAPAAEDDSAELAAVGAAVIDIDLDEPSGAVIDLDLDPASGRLADADDVFADVAVADADFHPSTESLDLVGLESGALAVGAVAISEPSAVDAAAAAAAAAARPNKRRRRLRARKSRRVIRHIDPWSVLTFSVLFHMCVFAAMLLSSVLVWNAATASGMVENIESFIQELGDYETFEINADVMFKASVIIAGMLTLASSVLLVLLTVVFNLISDLVGGIRVTVIEEETLRVPIDKKRSNAGVE